LIQVERRFQLPAPPGLGHGVILLLTWSLAFVFANLSLLSVNQHEWFFNLDTTQDKVEFGLWIARYVATVVVFCIGLKAPGISQTRDYMQQQNDDEEVRLSQILRKT
jgi:ATP-binding cassette subfamily B (MDR/TAP) protein 6